MLTLEQAHPAQEKTARAGRPSPKERHAAGKALRAGAPLDAHAAFSRTPTSPDPVTLLEERGAGRLPELVPIRYGRMLQSPFAFYRGAARVMAADLAGAPSPGLTVQMCGDAHVSNFGLYGSPERRLVFDANDFDETLPGPFEHDVKRLVASLVIAGREKGHRAQGAARPGRRRRPPVPGGDDTVRRGPGHRRLVLAHRRRRVAAAAVLAARQRSAQAAGAGDGKGSVPRQPAGVRQALGGRRRSAPDTGRPAAARAAERSPPGERGAGPRVGLQRADPPVPGVPDVRRTHLLEHYSFIDMARKVVGVGSGGTRCWVVLLIERDADDPLLLQIKEASPSVHAEFVGPSQYTNEGERVVAGQRLMQATSDIFLGWQRTTGIDGVERDFYFRQLRDWKGSFEMAELRPDGLSTYGEVCAWCLARAHARSGDRIAIAGYLGSSPAFEHSLVDFGEAYADVTESDHRRLAEAAAAGRVRAQSDL